MRNLKSLLLVSGLGAALGIAGLTGCQSWRGGTSERSAGRVVDDQRITHEVKAELRREPVYKFDDVDVRAFNGSVQLSGFVNTEEQKRRAGELAQQIPGVAQVINDIALKPIPPSPTGGTTNQVYRQ